MPALVTSEPEGAADATAGAGCVDLKNDKAASMPGTGQGVGEWWPRRSERKWVRQEVHRELDTIIQESGAVLHINCRGIHAEAENAVKRLLQ